MEITGLTLFFRYVLPCAEFRLRSGLITQEDYQDLYLIMENRELPSLDFLAHCFPGAIKSLFTFAQENKADPWSLETVRRYWREHHNHPESPVECGRISKFNRNLVSIVIDDRMLNCVNLYGLELNPDEEVFVHQRVIVEKKMET